MKSPLLQAVFAACVCVVALVGYGFWYAAVGEKSVAVADLQNQIVTKAGTASRIASSRASLAQIAGDEATIRSYFVSETEIVAFINALQERGRKQGATVSVSSVSSSESAAPVPALMLSLTISGTFDAVMRTVGAIEYAPYDLTVSGFSITRGAQSDWHATLNILVGSVSATRSVRTP